MGNLCNSCGFLLFFIKAENYISNGASTGSFRDIEIPDGVTLKTTLIPQGNRITGLRLLIITQSTEGYCLLELGGNEKVLSERKISLESVGGEAYYYIDVDWWLKEGEEYYICLTPMGGNSEFYTRIIVEGSPMLKEFPMEMFLGNDEMMGQPVAGIYYLQYEMPQGKQWLFLWITFLGICLAIGGLLYFISGIDTERKLLKLHK